MQLFGQGIRDTLYKRKTKQRVVEYHPIIINYAKKTYSAKQQIRDKPGLPKCLVIQLGSEAVKSGKD